jgi:RimJ/RimL family protein N-acetyltransferase
MSVYLYQDKLESDRLITRFLTSDDIRNWSDFFADKESVEFFPDPGTTSGYGRSQQWIEKQLKRYADNRYGLQALIDKQTGEFIGQCGLLAQDVDGIPEVEVGYHILKKFRGKGYAPEAARLFIEYAFKNNLTDSVISIIHVDNRKSQRVAEKNGLTQEKETSWSGLQVYIYRIYKL